MNEKKEKSRKKKKKERSRRQSDPDRPPRLSGSLCLRGPDEILYLKGGLSDPFRPGEVVRFHTSGGSIWIIFPRGEGLTGFDSIYLRVGCRVHKADSV